MWKQYDSDVIIPSAYRRKTIEIKNPGRGAVIEDK